MINLENLEKKLESIVKTDEYQLLKDKAAKANFVFFMGNGGNLAIASHAATDFGNYLKSKNSRAIDSSIKLTSKLDNNSDDIYQSSLEDAIRNIKTEEILVIFITSSGNNKRLNSAKDFLENKNISTFSLVGNCEAKENNIINLNVNYYHTAETLSLALVYNLINDLGGNLKKING